MVQNPQNPYDIRFGSQGERLVPDHLFTQEEYVELATFLDRTCSTVPQMVITEGSHSPDSIRDIVLRDLHHFKLRYHEVPFPEDPDPEDLQNWNDFVEMADHALRRAVLFYEPLEEAITFLGSEDDAMILWRIQKGK